MDTYSSCKVYYCCPIFFHNGLLYICVKLKASNGFSIKVKLLSESFKWLKEGFTLKPGICHSDLSWYNVIHNKNSYKEAIKLNKHTEKWAPIITRSNILAKFRIVIKAEILNRWKEKNKKSNEKEMQAIDPKNWEIAKLIERTRWLAKGQAREITLKEKGLKMIMIALISDCLCIFNHIILFKIEG